MERIPLLAHRYPCIKLLVCPPCFLEMISTSLRTLFLVYVGILMGVAQIGMLLGPVLGGALTQYSTWRWCKISSPSLLI